MVLITQQRNVTVGSTLSLRLTNLHTFMFSGRYHLTTSAFAWFSPSMMGLMLWITSFNRYRTFLLLLLLNVFVKVRAVYFNADSTISGAFQCSACSAGAPPTCTSSTISFWGVEGPFLDEVGPYRVVWRNCWLAECVGALSQLLNCISKL